MHQPIPLQLGLFAATWAIAIYLINCLVAREYKKIDLRQAALHVSAMAMIGVIGEVFVGSVYHALFGKTLWHYTAYPVHHAYTSAYALFLWGIYGFRLYLLHGTLNKRRRLSLHTLALLFCVEAIVIEALLNVTYRLRFGNFIYYYMPADLGHITSVQTLPFYLLAGYVIVTAFRKFETSPSFYACMSASIAGVIVFLT